MNGMEMRFKKGDIAYWHTQIDGYHFVEYGMVIDHYSDSVLLDILDIAERRKVDGKPIEQMPFIGEWHKLPKGWTYNTKLFDITTDYSDFPEWVWGIKIDDPEQLKRAYDEGYLVKAKTKTCGHVETEITKQGYRLVVRGDTPSKRGKTHAIQPKLVYSTFAEAKAEVDAYMAELHRQSELTDYEWSVEQIDKELDKWQRNYSIADDIKKLYRDWILSLKNVEEISVRIFYGKPQMKREKQRTWHNIEIGGGAI